MPDSISALLPLLSEQYGDRPALCYCVREERRWEKVSFRQLHSICARVATVLRGCGVVNKTVGIWMEACVEWELADKAVLLAGGAVFGLDPEAGPEKIVPSLRLTNAVGLIVDHADRCKDLDFSALPEVRLLVYLRDSPSFSVPPHVTVLCWSQLQSLPSVGTASPSTVDPSATAMLLETSGTTGAPKCIAYSNRQLMQACEALLGHFAEPQPGERTISWLPLHYPFQRIANLYALAKGLEIWFSSPKTLARDIRIARPAGFVAIPRALEKIREAIVERVAHQLFPLNRLGGWAARRALGGRIRFILTGSAPCPMEVLQFFHGARIPVLEAYGMSENIIPTCANRLSRFELGTVGSPLVEGSVRLAPDGEILVRSPGLCQGYLESSEPLPRDKDGFFFTGDLGAWSLSQNLRILGRKNDLIKTSTGKKIAPWPIEECLRRTKAIKHIVIVGNGRKFLTAIVVPVTRVRDESERLSLIYQLEKALEELPATQRVQGWVISDRDFLASMGEVTANLKLKRDVIETNYRSQLDQVYSSYNEKKIA